MKKFLIILIFPLICQAYTLTSVDCLTLNSFHEANTATLKEQQLVNDVVINRALLQNKAVCAIVFSKNQFSWTKNYHLKTKFSSQDKMLSYYKTDKDSYIKLNSVAVNSILAHSAIMYKPLTNYHDKSITKFPHMESPKKLVKVIQTKHFVFYADKDFYGKLAT